LAGHVVAGVHHDQDVAVAFLVVPGLDQAGDHLTELDGGDGRDVGAGLQYAVKHRPHPQPSRSGLLPGAADTR
jgi:hypothetical protein